MAVIDLGIEGLSDYRELGSGGFARVYAATDHRFGRTVAVKVLYSLDEAGRRRFEREQLSMGRMTGHPNVVIPHSSGYTADGAPYLLMEHLDGGALADRLGGGRTLTWDQAVELLIPIADALGHGHAQGILHRDVKPENILLGGNGVTKLADFGIASIREATATQAVAFSLAHAPPETFTGGADRSDQRSDLYSLASTLFTLVAGRPPFHSDDPGDSQMAYIVRIAEHPVPALGADERHDAFLATALAKNPDDRPADAAHFVALLRATTTPAAVAAPPPAAPPQAAPPHQLAHATAAPHVPASAGPSGHPAPPNPATPAPAAGGPTGGGAAPPDPASHAPTAGEPTGHQAPPNPAATDPGAASWPGTPSGPGSVSGAASPNAGLGTPSGQGSGAAGWPASPNTGRAGSPVAGWQEGHDGSPGPAGGGYGVVDSARAAVPRPPGVAPPVGDAARSRGGADAAARGLKVAIVVGLVAVIGIAGFVGLQALGDSAGGDGATPGSTAAISDESENASPDEQPDQQAEASQPLVFHGHQNGRVTAVTALADGRVASGAGSGQLLVWDPSDPTAEPYTVAIPHGSRINALITLADGRIAAGSTEPTVDLWDPAEPDRGASAYAAHTDWINAIAQLPDGRMVSGDENSEIHIWDPANPTQAGVLYTQHTDWINGIVALGDGLVASGDEDDTVHVWDPDDPLGAPLLYTGHTGYVNDLVQLPDGRIASASDDDTVRLWDPGDPDALDIVYTGHTDHVNDLAVLPDGRLASASDDDTIRVWDPNDLGVPAVVYDRHLGDVNAVAVLDDGRVVSAGEDGVHIWSP